MANCRENEGDAKMDAANGKMENGQMEEGQEGKYETLLTTRGQPIDDGSGRRICRVLNLIENCFLKFQNELLLISVSIISPLETSNYFKNNSRRAAWKPQALKACEMV